MKLLTEYTTSGLSQKEFVEKYDLSFSTFQYWLYRRSKSVRSESGSTARFLPVELVPSPALKARAEESSARIELELPSGVRVRLGADTSARFLGEVVAALK